MSERFPRLTTMLAGPDKPEVCRCCGDADASLWQEHDDRDQPEHRYLWLCEKCSDRIIEPHPRLYAKIDDNTPAPGAMRICADCTLRAAGGRCACPTAKANGGPGINITTTTGFHGFIDGRDKSGRRWGRRFTHYPSPPSACSGKQTTPTCPPPTSTNT